MSTSNTQNLKTSNTSTCPVCGKAFEPKRGAKFGSKFCSMKCYQKNWWAEKKKDVRKVCKVCGKEFHPCTEHRSYCSPECLAVGRKDNRRGKSHTATGVVYDRVCDFCGKPFTTNKPNKRFCCKKCQKTDDNRQRRDDRKAKVVVLTKTCVWCGETFETTKSFKICCSPKCSYNYNNHQCSKAELEERRQAKREEAVRKAAEKAMKVRVNGLTEEQMQAVVDAQDGDQSQLYRLSRSWTPAQHKYAKARYEGIHGLFAQTFRG